MLGLFKATFLLEEILTQMNKTKSNTSLSSIAKMDMVPEFVWNDS